MSVVVISDETGRIAKQLRELARKTVTIGVHDDADARAAEAKVAAKAKEDKAAAKAAAKSGATPAATAVAPTETKAETAGYPIAELAAVHEFGTKDGRIPERSFLRAGLAKADEEIKLDLLGQIQDMIVTGAPSPHKIALRGGVLILGAVRKEISGGIAPALSEKTKARRDKKGSNSVGVASNVGQYTPLVDTGQLWQSLVVRVGEAG